ncbi:putative porin, partial [Nonlabens ulvanivorans]
NAKVRQTRIFFKLEHLNQLFASGDDYFSAPRTPYRDFTVRFGVVWNFFL